MMNPGGHSGDSRTLEPRGGWFHRLGMTLALTALLLTTACGTQPREIEENSARDGWRVVYNGFGTVTHSDSSIVLAPAPATTDNDSHGALVVDDRAPADIELSATIFTEEQFSADEAPDPWQVGWLLWRYSDADHFYALTLKPNGWELTKQDPAYPEKQRFLAADSTPAFPVRQPHSVWIQHRADTIAVQVNGTPLITYTDQERPYPDGGIALYTEGARVTFSGVHYQPALGTVSQF